MAAPFLSCVHTHTHFCDGKNAPSVMAQKAAELGFVSLGYSGHGYAHWDPCSMKPEAEQQYREEIQNLQKEYTGKLEILLGLEHDALGDYPTETYDYLIDSVHAMMVQGELCFIDWSEEKMLRTVEELFGGNVYAYAKAYFETCAGLYEHSPAQIAGHLDLVTKFNEKNPLMDVEDPRFLYPALEALDCALDRGLVPEVNTGAISRGYRTTPYPGKAILRHLAERKAPVVVTSDCHDANFLDCNYDQVAELLREAGFRSTLRLRRSGWEEIGL